MSYDRCCVYIFNNARLSSSKLCLLSLSVPATSSSDPWNLDNMNKSLPSEQQQQLKHRKTPQDFLGENANLVNLDQLVTKNESAGKVLLGFGLTPHAKLCCLS